MWILALALGCTENKLHTVDSGAPAGEDSVPTEDTETPTDTQDTQDTQTPEDPCDDAPDVESTCDGLDEDCDGTVDEGDDLAGCIAWWPDADSDDLGTGEPGCTCELPDDAALAPGDCDDTDPTRQVCRSCLDVLDRGLGSTDGAYTIDPDGTGIFEVLCDMSHDGGGWTLVLSLNALGMTHYDGAEVFETQAGFGTWADDNHLSPGFFRLSFTSSYVVDATHGVPVAGEETWTGGTLGQEIDAMLAGTPTASSVWARTPRTALQLRNSETTDNVFKDGDLRVHFLLNAAATSELAWPVSLEYQADERHLVFDSDFGYAGARIYTDEPYDVAVYGVDERFRLFLR